MIPCRACKQPVKWVKTIHGKSMPVNPEPHPEGNLSLDDEGVVHVLTGVWLTMARDRGEKLFISHFAVCTKAKKLLSRIKARQKRRLL